MLSVTTGAASHTRDVTTMEWIHRAAQKDSAIALLPHAYSPNSSMPASQISEIPRLWETADLLQGWKGKVPARSRVFTYATRLDENDPGTSLQS